MAEDNNTGGGLRAQLEDALAQIDELKGQVESSQDAQRELAFLKAGIDTSEGVGKLLAKSYDGELEPEAIATFAEEYGVEPSTPASEAPAEGDEQSQRIDGLRRESTPEGAGKRLSMSEWTQLSKDDPSAAKQAHDQGMVDFPSHIAQNLAAAQ